MSASKSIELLNQGVADELQAVHQYMYWHFHLDDQGFAPLAGLLKRVAIMEMGHVEQLAERILFLGGDVKMAVAGPVETTTEPQAILERAAAMEQQAAAERERRAIETMAEGNKNAAILEADGKLEAAKREARAQVALAEASAEAIARISDSIRDRELPAMFLLGDRYITSLEKISQSENSKFVIYPADLQQAIKGMLGGVFKAN